jgi:hypothetical protein
MMRLTTNPVQHSLPLIPPCDCTAAPLAHLLLTAVITIISYFRPRYLGSSPEFS